MNKNIVAALVALVVVFGAGYYLAKPSQSNLGGLSERDIRAVSLGVGQTSASQRFMVSSNGVTTQGGVLSTSTPASLTLQASDIVDRATLFVTPTTGATTLTLPASTTLAALNFLPNAGDRTRIVIVNASTTVAKNLTIAAGTGSLLVSASTTAQIQSGANGGVGNIEIIRKANSDYLFQLSTSI